MSKKCKDANRLLLVTGVYRSGTSATALALSKLGHFSGRTRDFNPADSFNEDGYFENKHFLLLNSLIMKHLGLSDYESRPIPSDWSEYPMIGAYENEVASILSSQYRNLPFSGWKDPRTTPLLPFYEQALSIAGATPYYVMPVRNPLDVANSMTKKNSIPFHLGLGVWVHYMLCGLQFSPPERSYLFLYEDLLKDPQSVLAPIFDRFKFGQPTSRQWEQARSSIRPTLSHGRSEVSELGAAGICGRVFDLLKRVVSNEGDYVKGAFRDEISALWLEWIATGSLFHRATLVRSTLSLHGAAPRHVKMERLIWSSITVPVVKQERPRITLTVGDQVGIVYLRNARLISEDGAETPLTGGFGPDTYGETIEPNLLRFVVFGQGRHFAIQLPSIDSSYVLKAEVFSQFGFDFMHDPLEFLLKRNLAEGAPRK